MVMICLREKLDKSELRKLVKAVDKSLIWKLSRENLNSSVWFTFDWHLIKNVSNVKIFGAFILKWTIPKMRKRFERCIWLWRLRSAFVFVKWAELSWVQVFVCICICQEWDSKRPHLASGAVVTIWGAEGSGGGGEERLRESPDTWGGHR